ncbi:hypothetical protein FJ955_25770 [Mesorhizobium sp. B2-2-2]|nr:hypothetical protein FJ955_25770 [Mesorhizobium sp. B2-2-2]
MVNAGAKAGRSSSLVPVADGEAHDAIVIDGRETLVMKAGSAPLTCIRSAEARARHIYAAPQRERAGLASSTPNRLKPGPAF